MTQYLLLAVIFSLTFLKILARRSLSTPGGKIAAKSMSKPFIDRSSFFPRDSVISFPSPNSNRQFGQCSDSCGAHQNWLIQHARKLKQIRFVLYCDHLLVQVQNIVTLNPQRTQTNVAGYNYGFIGVVLNPSWFHLFLKLKTIL